MQLVNFTPHTFYTTVTFSCFCETWTVFFSCVHIHCEVRTHTFHGTCIYVFVLLLASFYCNGIIYYFICCNVGWLSIILSLWSVIRVKKSITTQFPLVCYARCYTLESPDIHVSANAMAGLMSYDDTHLWLGGGYHSLYKVYRTTIISSQIVSFLIIDPLAWARASELPLSLAAQSCTALLVFRILYRYAISLQV